MPTGVSSLAPDPGPMALYDKPQALVFPRLGLEADLKSELSGLLVEPKSSQLSNSRVGATLAAGFCGVNHSRLES